MNAPLLNRPLGQILIAGGHLSEDQLRIALLEQNRRHRPLGRILVGLGFIDEACLRQALAAKHGKAAVDLGRLAVAPAALQWIPRELARRLRVLPLDYDPATPCLTLAAADVHDLLGLEQISRQLPAGCRIETLLAGEADIECAIDRHYGHELAIDGILREIESGENGHPGPSTADGEHRQPIVRLIDALLTDAVKRGASDIHFEPEAGFLRIRYRIDGMLRPIRIFHQSLWSPMSVRLKVLAGMNIAEMRAPQDGRIGLTIAGRPIDLRAACLPTIHGENIVLRILDRQQGIVPLAELGVDAGQLQVLKQMIARPEGLILLTGPTGSGKTTTLYSILKHINHEGIHIMTLEDPVEYPMPLVRQTAVAEAAKLDFANGVRALMRQDPDVILVGEIRDQATAAMAFRAAMTGHQVYSTLHANSAIGALPRLRDLGIEPGIVAGNLIGIVAQRLLRRLCEHCKRAAPANIDEMRLLGLAAGTVPPLLHRPQGCPHCEQQGYRGRLAIVEVLRCDPELDELIASRAGAREIHRHAAGRGYVPLAEAGLRHVLDGSTSLAELVRVVDLSERM